MTAQDPQRVDGPYRYSPPQPPCTCGHLAGVHRVDGEHRGACTSGTPAGPCACRRYRPAQPAQESAPVGRGERLLTPSEVAALFNVVPKTVTRWAKDGKLRAIRTLGGHRRYLESEVRAALQLEGGDQR